MKHTAKGLNANRRWFMKRALVAAGATSAGSGLLAKPNGKLSKGDAALLSFAAAAEILESDFWVQYNELGGIQDKEVPGGTGNPVYTAKLQVLDSDFPQYIHDNTDDEITHFHIFKRVSDVKGCGSSQSRPVSHFAGKHGYWVQRKTKTHKSHATHPGYQLVDTVSQQRE